jgi:hypothetical protein
MLINKTTHCFDCDRGELRRFEENHPETGNLVAVYRCDRCSAHKYIHLDNKAYILMEYHFTNGKVKYY